MGVQIVVAALCSHWSSSRCCSHYTHSTVATRLPSTHCMQPPAATRALDTAALPGLHQDVLFNSTRASPERPLHLTTPAPWHPPLHAAPLARGTPCPQHPFHAAPHPPGCHLHATAAPPLAATQHPLHAPPLAATQHLTHQAAVCTPQLHPPGEAAAGHVEAVGPLKPPHQNVTAVRGHVHAAQVAPSGGMQCGWGC